jgi:hypothetical protein
LNVLILCERIVLAHYEPVTYLLARETQNLLFNKSKAFNLAAAHAPSDRLVLHDADMLAQGHYTAAVAAALVNHDSCHLGSTVIYTSQESMGAINQRQIVDEAVKCDRVVGYYEGGSLACTKKTFWRVGGFNEDYWGYGCEDCDIYARLSGGSRWKEDRCFDFLHMWHPRVSGWSTHHDNNRLLEGQLKRKTIQERIQLQHVQLQRLGYDKELVEALR